MDASTFHRLVNDLQDNPELFHAFVFEPQAAAPRLGYLGPAQLKMLQAVHPASLLADAIGMVEKEGGPSACGPDTTCSCTSSTCGGVMTCGGSTCDVTCTDTSCGNTCGGSCGFTTNFENQFGLESAPAWVDDAQWVWR